MPSTASNNVPLVNHLLLLSFDRVLILVFDFKCSQTVMQDKERSQLLLARHMYLSVDDDLGKIELPRDVHMVIFSYMLGSQWTTFTHIIDLRPQSNGNVYFVMISSSWEREFTMLYSRNGEIIDIIKQFF